MYEFMRRAVQAYYQMLFTAFPAIEKLLQKHFLVSRHRNTLLPTSPYATKDRAAIDNFWCRGFWRLVKTRSHFGLAPFEPLT
jgi:hypothetical protein